MIGDNVPDDDGRLLLENNAKVVAYLEPSMSRDLLGKFPDHSSLGFDYCQSSIWSPLLPRSHFPMDFDSSTPPKRRRHAEAGLKKLGSCVKKKIDLAVISARKATRMSRKKAAKVSVVSPTSMNNACAPFPRLGWNKALKAATKHFKKMKKKEKQVGPTVPVELSSYVNGVVP